MPNRTGREFRPTKYVARLAPADNLLSFLAAKLSVAGDSRVAFARAAKFYGAELMKKFLLLSAIYLFAPQLALAEDFDDLRRALIARMPDVAIGAIRKLPYADLYEIQGNGVNVFYTDATGEIVLFGNLIPGVLPRTPIESLPNSEDNS
jgi:hypothetical protein